MKTLFLNSTLFQKVAMSSQCQLTHVLTDNFSVNEQVRVIECFGSYQSASSNIIMRFVTDISETEQLTCDDFISTITLSTKPLSI